MRNILFILLFAISLLKAQQPPSLIFHHFTTKSLPAISYVQDEICAKDGMVWLATNNGLIKWDGKNFKQYEHIDGNNNSLPSNETTKILEDKEGNIWIGTTSGLSLLNTYTEKIKTFTSQKGDAFIMPFFIDSSNKLWLYNPNSKCNLQTYDIKSKVFLNNDTNFIEQVFFYPKTSGSIPKICIGMNHTYGIKIGFFENEKIVKYESAFDGLNNFPRIIISWNIYIENENTVWLGSNAGLIKFNPFTKKYKQYNTFNGQSIGLLEKSLSLNNQYLAVTSKGNGLFIFDKLNEKFVQHYTYQPGDPDCISNNTINQLLITKDNNLIINCLNAGIDIANLDKLNFSKLFTKAQANEVKCSNDISKILILKNNLWCLTNDNKIEQLNTTSNNITKTIITEKLNSFFEKKIISAWAKQSENELWIATKSQLFYVNISSNLIENKTSFLNNNLENENISALSINSNNEIHIATNSEIFSLIKKNDIWVLNKSKSFKKLRSNLSTFLLEDNDDKNSFFALAEYGSLLVQFKKDKYDNPEVINTKWLPSSANQLCMTNKNQLLIAAKNGLYIVDKTTLNLNKINTDNRLNAEINSVANGENYFWIATFNGLFKLNTNTFQIEDNINTDAVGYQNSNNNAIAVNENKYIYFGGQNGIISISTLPTTKIIHTPKLYIKQILVNDKYYKIDSLNNITNISFPKNENTISFRFSIIDFSGTNQFYLYKLNGIDKDWVRTDIGEARYSNLPKGTYEFEIKLEGVNNSLKKITVAILPDWYETILFKLLAFITVFIIFYMVYKDRLIFMKAKTDAKKKELQLKQLTTEFEKQLVASEMATLRSQMNPHFIFNALNSINRFILTADTETASAQLNQFSKLMRLVLENSKSTVVTLAKDLEALQLYLIVEKSRFHDDFEYIFNIDEKIDINFVKIPPLLIQPYIENAIWHGLMQKESKDGLVKINISNFNDESLKIIIEDNGIGRTKSKELNSLNLAEKKSFGLQITQDRINLLNKLFDIKASVTIGDMYNNNNISIGTRVTLIIPIS